MSRFGRREKFSLNFSRLSFVIRVNLSHPCSFMVYYHLFGVFCLCKVLISGFLEFKGDFACGQNTSGKAELLLIK